MGSNQGPEARKERGFLPGFSLEFSFSLCGQECELPSTASESDGAVFYLPGQAKCQHVGDRHKDRDTTTLDFELCGADLANKFP